MYYLLVLLVLLGTSCLFNSNEKNDDMIIEDYCVRVVGFEEVLKNKDTLFVSLEIDKVELNENLVEFPTNTVGDQVSSCYSHLNPYSGEDSNSLAVVSIKIDSQEVILDSTIVELYYDGTQTITINLEDEK